MKLTEEEYKIALATEPKWKLNGIIGWNTLGSAYFRKGKDINNLTKNLC